MSITQQLSLSALSMRQECVRVSTPSRGTQAAAEWACTRKPRPGTGRPGRISTPDTDGAGRIGRRRPRRTPACAAGPPTRCDLHGNGGPCRRRCPPARPRGKAAHPRPRGAVGSARESATPPHHPGAVSELTLKKLIYPELTWSIETLHSSGDPRQWTPTANNAPQSGAHPEELRGMSFAQFRADLKRAGNRRRLYARINALPDSTVRDELIAVAQRYEREGADH